MIDLVIGVAPTPTVFELAVKGGIMMIPIAICSLIVVTVVAERLTLLRISRVIPSQFRSGLVAALKIEGSEAIRVVRKLVERPTSPAARVIAAGAARHGEHRDSIERSLATAGEDEIYHLRGRLRVLTVIAAIAPLLGLTGTIFGMIRAFQTVAASGESLGKAELLAGGIYEAMITTAAGLLVAIPTLVFAHWFAGKVELLTRELDKLAIAFTDRFAGGRAEGHHAHEGIAQHAHDAEAPSDNGLTPASAVGAATTDS